ncbi:exosortase E/protease, VPEID-CTERM system [Gynuella sp.]|uniref:exosortase E/protease, VPEID-CTERM system n=1 Tax=Gynuella sp. TaxID=2969146 RepID=UPI003D11C6B0
MHTTNTVPPRRPSQQHSTIIITVLLLLLAGEILFISQTFDAYLLFKRQNLSLWQEVFGQLGRFAKVLTLTIVMVVIQIKSRLSDYWQQLNEQFSSKALLYSLPLHGLSYATLLYFCSRLFTGLDQPIGNIDYLGWVFAAAFTFGFWLISICRFGFVVQLLKQEKYPLLIAIAISVLVWLFTTGTSALWDPLSEGTFTLSAIWLALFNPDLVVVYPAAKVLGLGDFVVNIAAACSGYEGIGLITAFTSIYLYLHKGEFRYPHSLLLFPLGITVIWLLNSVRIALLVWVGYYWSKDIAVGGFHSQAGWIMFILTSLLLLWIAGSIRYFRHPAARPVKTVSTDNVPVATLMPMIALLAVSILTSAFISDFDWLYPLRVIAVTVVLAKYWSRLNLLPYRPGWEPMAAGILVAVLWVLLVPQNPEYNDTFQATLNNTSDGIAWGWLLIRFLGAAVTVPIAEELAFRAYLLCRLSRSAVILRGEVSVTWAAVAVSSLAFGALHGAWLAGTVAGVIYAIVRMRSNSISAPILAHSLTNALLFAIALMSGNWGLI